MFRLLRESDTRFVTVFIDDVPYRVPCGVSVAAAMLLHLGGGPTRTTPISQSPRAPSCMMGVCFECLAAIDGVPNRQGCLTPVAEGMQIRRQIGARTLGR